MPQDSIRLAGANSAAGSLLAQLKARVLILAAFVGSMWLVFFLSAALPFLHLNRHGVVPRTLGGLQGILFAPWLHASLVHLIANTSGLLILGWLCMWPRIDNFWQASYQATRQAYLSNNLRATIWDSELSESQLRERWRV
jgi:hypothetical protein